MWHREIIGGLTVAFALILETIAFSVVAGVDPAVGLCTSVIMSFVLDLTVCRPAMITAAGVARLQRFVPRSVMIGFVNPLG